MIVALRDYASAVPDAVVERLKGARHVLAVGHENPDGDSLGATLAVTLLAEVLGARATPVSSDPVPALYDYLPGVERVRTDPPSGEKYDLLVVSDCGSLERVGPIRDRHRELFDDLPRVILDHHLSNETQGPADWIDPASAATCEMTTLLAVRLGVPLDACDGALASALMTGIVMDTATFAHPNATPRTLAVSAALLGAGAPMSDISRRLYRTKPERQLRLFGRVLDRLSTSRDGRVIWSSLYDEDLAATGTDSTHSEGIIDLLSQSEEAEVAILFKQDGAGTRVSVRTKPGGVDATVLTGKFGGGGHARAAGARIDRTVAEARPLVLAEAERLAAAVSR